MALEFSPQARQRLQAVRDRYPNAQAACLPALWIAQEEFGFVPEEAVDLVARELGLSPAHVHGVVTFYTMYQRKKPGRYHLQLCTNIACMVNGAYNLLTHLTEKLRIKPGETTPDGVFTLSEVECLACCGQAPAMLVNDAYHYDLTREKVDDLIAGLWGKGTSHV
ncbi:MAG TPA: NAD(P)H-dependent oxidoreductase subunit E [Polyangia bacterium]|jgi:NADH-quinone oxidoreductase subunit E